MMSMDDDLPLALATDLDRAFESLVRVHEGRLYTIALRVLGDPADAEEIAQDALVRAYRAMTGYPPERIRGLRLRPWLATIVVNLARNRATRRRPPATLSIDVPGPDGRAADELLPGSTDEPSLIAERREGVAHWSALLAGLPDRYRVPVVLRHVDGLSFADMSAALGRPEGTLKAQVHRGLARLRAAHDATHGAERQEIPA
jgi:RNA polymerase sigma-70 factor (ECF subfamily)